MKNVFHSQLQQ